MASGRRNYSPKTPKNKKSIISDGPALYVAWKKEGGLSINELRQAQLSSRISWDADCRPLIQIPRSLFLYASIKSSVEFFCDSRLN